MLKNPERPEGGDEDDPLSTGVPDGPGGNITVPRPEAHRGAYHAAAAVGLFLLRPDGLR